MSISGYKLEVLTISTPSCISKENVFSTILPSLLTVKYSALLVVFKTFATFPADNKFYKDEWAKIPPPLYE